MERLVARVRFEELDNGGHGESSASEDELGGNTMNWSEEGEGMSGDETRRMLTQQNRKGKKSGGFQSMGMNNTSCRQIPIDYNNHHVGLSHPVFTGVMRKGYRVPTPIQRKVRPT